MRFLLALSSLIFALPVFAYDCNTPVQDPAFVLEKGLPQITTAILNASNKGVDVKVIATNDFSDTGEWLAKQMVRQCSNWQSVGHGVKNNLILFTIFPRAHSVGMFVGSEFGKAVNPTQIKTEFMIPAFRDGDFVRGVVNGINQTAIQIDGYKTAPLHGTTVVKQATDFHGLWVAMYITLGLVALAGLFFLFFYLTGKRRERQAAQRKAVNARNYAALYANSYPDSDGATEFARMASSETYNPDTPGLSTESYEAIASAYRALTFKEKKTYTTPETPYKSTYETSEMKYQKYSDYRTETGFTKTEVPTTTTTVVNTTVVEPYVTPYIPPVVVEEVYTPRITDPSDSAQSSYSDRSPYSSDFSPDSSPSSSSWSGSSSSSSWSDSSSSSSWSDSSSSSSWSDSGSSSGGDSSW